MRKRILSLLLSLVLLMSLVGPETIAYADGNSGSGSNKGIELKKTATPNPDGTYTITLEAYATGSKVISEVTKDIPTDIILVLDQSGSMGHDMGTVSFEKYADDKVLGYVIQSHTRNEDYYEYRHNGGDGNLWYRLNDDSYVSVSVTKQEVISYSVFSNKTNESLWGNKNNLYVKKDGQYVKVNVERTGARGIYTYSIEGNQIASARGMRGMPTIENGMTDDGKFYLATKNESETIYTYTYTDANNAIQTIGTSTGATTVFTPTLYKRNVDTSGGGTRLNALKGAVNTFVNEVAKKAAGPDGDLSTKADNINHRVAVVGFASESGDGNNTELLSISGKNSGTVGVKYSKNISTQNLKDVLQRMDTQAGQTMVTSAISALAAEGATRTDLGLDMAERILSANPVATDEERNRVVVVFTDGSPTSSNGFETDIANDAITKAKAIKEAGAITKAKTTVYSVGIFAGADASSAGTKPSQDLSSNSTKLSSACNWFMQQISSNEEGKPSNPSYYLSAADADTLNSIFKQISDQIQTGGSTSSLTNESVIRDVISPQFTLSEGADASNISLETYRCTGKKGNEYTWEKNNGAMGAEATVDGDKVNVTGFNFSENYVGPVTENGSVSYRGHKLVIKFNVVAKDGMLGGNKIPTNTHAGIYENSSSTEPVEEFEKPVVNVNIPQVTVEAKDKNVYLKGEVTAEELRSGAVIKAGSEILDLSKTNYGLESWQNEYVDIKVEITDKDNKDVTNKIADLTDDSTYNVIVTISPKYSGPVTAEVGKGTADINVFKPELTFKDGYAYYGEDATATDFTVNKVGEEVWKHSDTLSTTGGVTIIGNKPELTMGYTLDKTKLAEEKYYTKQDLPVIATVKIGETDVTDKTTFVHQDCDPKCNWTTPTTPGNPAFLMHIKTCQLAITKTGGAEGEPYVFTVMKDGKKYSEVTIVGNKSVTISELPVGTYSIEEDTGWSWRYKPSYSGSGNLSSTSPTGTLTCTNTKKNNKWLNEFSAVVENIFGQSQVQKN